LAARGTAAETAIAAKSKCQRIISKPRLQVRERLISARGVPKKQMLENAPVIQED
jgi:hypothetical protein